MLYIRPPKDSWVCYYTCSISWPRLKCWPVQRNRGFPALLPCVHRGRGRGGNRCPRSPSCIARRLRWPPGTRWELPRRSAEWSGPTAPPLHYPGNRWKRNNNDKDNIKRFSTQEQSTSQCINYMYSGVAYMYLQTLYLSKSLNFTHETIEMIKFSSRIPFKRTS